MVTRFSQIGGLNLRTSPFNHNGLLRAVNVTTDQIGAKTKRPGYNSYLGTPDNSQVNTLFNWTRENGTQFWNYRFSGSQLYYSTQGTAAWTVCGNGTFSGGSHIGNTVVNDVMIVGDGVNATRHTTDGTSFSNTGAAPIAEFFDNFQGRAWAGGTASYIFYSTVGTVSDWTTDSSSILIPDAGKLGGVYKNNNLLFSTKNSGKQFNYDGYQLTDMANDLGYTSIYSMGEIAGYKVGLNRLGFFGNGGGQPELLSKPVQKLIYNNAGNGISGSIFTQAPGESLKYEYYCGVGTVSEDLTYGTINNCVMKYDLQLNEWLNYSFYNNPTAFNKYKDENGNDQLIFGDANGQCYQLAGTAMTDNGQPINTEMMGFYDGGNLEEKKWDMVRMVLSPRSEAHVQLALVNYIDLQNQNIDWIDLTPEKSGLMEYHFPGDSRARFILYRVYESSTETRYSLYTIEFHFDVIEH